MIKGIIFDMDGLMINSEEVTFEGYVELCARRGCKLSRETYLNCLGKPVAQIWQVFYDAFGNDFPAPEIMKENHIRMAAQFAAQGVPLKPGLIELLQYLKANDYKTCVATSSTRDRVDTILAQAKIAKYFDASICGNEVEKGKPDPEIFIKASRKLELPVEQCLVLEDSEMGIQAAYDGHIPVVCIPDMKYPEQKYEKMTCALFDKLTDVIPYLEKSEQS